MLYLHLTDRLRRIDGALVVTTPQDVAIIDVRKEISFCKKTGLPVLGVVENMAGLQTPLANLTFRSADGADVSEELAKCIPPHLQSAVACCEVFAPSKGGAEAMSQNMGVPFLGRVPLDPKLSRAAEDGSSLQEAQFQHATSLPAFNSIVAGAPLITAPARSVCMRAVADVTADLSGDCS